MPMRMQTNVQTAPGHKLIVKLGEGLHTQQIEFVVPDGVTSVPFSLDEVPKPLVHAVGAPEIGAPTLTINEQPK